MLIYTFNFTEDNVPCSTEATVSFGPMCSPKITKRLNKSLEVLANIKRVYRLHLLKFTDLHKMAHWSSCELKKVHNDLYRIYILIIPILCVAGTPLADAWLSISLHIHMRGRRLNGDVGLRRVSTFVYFSLLHCCDIWYSCMCGSRTRGDACCYQLVIALSLCARPLAAARAWTAHNAPLDTSSVFIFAKHHSRCSHHVASEHGPGTRSR